MKTLNKIGSIVAGGLLIGSAMAGMAAAGMENSGIDHEFFYDNQYNPIVQVVVGEKGLATDAVAAGNIAAVIGNLAYTKAVAEVNGSVTLGVSSKGATGKFEQMAYSASDEIISIGSSGDGNGDFYNDDIGLDFDNEDRTYDRGSFIKYSLACDMSQRETADLLQEPSFSNIHCFFCETLCLSQLENPEHEMSENIGVNYDKMHIYEEGLNDDNPEKLVLKIDSKALTYNIDTGGIPATSIKDNDEYVDFEWRGKMLLFGEEFHVTDISKNEIVIAKGQDLDISSEAFSDKYNGYKFKIEHLIYSTEYQVAGILLEVEKPDGTVVQTQISKMANGIVDDIEVAGIYAEESDGIATADILVYDTLTSMTLKDGKDIEIGGEVKKGWRTQIGHQDSEDSDVDEYRNTEGTVISNITVTYTKTAYLDVGESLDFPSNFKLEFKGYLDNNYMEKTCDELSTIEIEKVEDYRLVMSFKADNTENYEYIHLDQGPFSQGDRFIIGGKIYEYIDIDSQDDNHYDIVLEDVLDGGKHTISMSPQAATGPRILNTLAFEDPDDNDEEIDLDFDEDILSTDVFMGQFQGLNLLLEDSNLFVVETTNITELDGSYVGILPEQIGTFDDFYMEGGKSYLYAVKENGTEDLNDDGNANDVLLVFRNPTNEYSVIDLYDRDHDESSSLDYKQGIKAGTNEPSPDFEYDIEIDDEDDTVLMLPAGGTDLTISWDDDLLTEEIKICQPTDYVYPSIFIGTTEAMEIADATINEGDEGTEKTLGCCTYLVKDFEVNGDTTTIQPNKLIGNLVVSETAANTNQNLIIVGGPAVNGLSNIIKEDIETAEGKYIVKRSGKKIYVAGWEAAETIDAGNALTEWLYENIH